jgi:hypothetical protein
MTEPPSEHFEPGMAPPPSGAYPADSRFTLLRKLRAEVQDLQAVFESVHKGQITIKSYAGYVEKTRQDIAQIMEALRGDMEDSDTIRHLHNAWEQMMVNPIMADPNADFTPEDQLNYLNLLDQHMRKIVFLVGSWTIPRRLNDWLRKARPGHYIPFHLVFDDELPDPQDRARVLNYLAWAPKVIKGGIVDPADGLVYRYAESIPERIRTLVVLALVFLLLTGMVVRACYVPYEDWPIKAGDLPALLTGWGAVLVGIVVHVAVGSVKRRRRAGGLPELIAVGDLPLILNARSGQMLLKLVLAAIGFFGFVFAAGVKNVTPLNALLVGYSLDSVVELFGTSLERQAEAQAAAIKRELGITS